jgi:hypothetical protein
MKFYKKSPSTIIDIGDVKRSSQRNHMWSFTSRWTFADNITNPYPHLVFAGGERLEDDEAIIQAKGHGRTQRRSSSVEGPPGEDLAARRHVSIRGWSGVDIVVNSKRP